MEIIISFGHETENSAARNLISGAEAEVLNNLIDSTGETTSVGFELLEGSNVGPVGLSAGDTQGIEDAFWVEPWMNKSASGNFGAVTLLGEFNALPPGEYIVETYGISSSATRLLGSSVFDADPLSHSIELNISRTNRHQAVSPDAEGTIPFSVYRDGDTGSGSTIIAAVRIYSPDTSAKITVTNPPQGGELFSFSGSNYAAQPTGPMTFTQGTRTISRAVTISNWDAEDGSFTGVTDTALPGVPAAGASDSPALLYGEPVTINLPDPGA